MATDFIKRAAALAVSRYGAKRSRVNLAIQATVQSQAQGIEGDLLDMLVVRKLLTPAQAEELRRDLDREEGQEPRGNPTPAPAVESDSSDLLASQSGQVPRSLGSYRLLRRLGVGGMGTVYLAYDEAQRTHFAIKILAEQLAGNKDYVDRFHREAKSGTQLDHPNIVRCVGAGFDAGSGKHFLVMEYVAGPSVSALIDRHKKVPIGDAVHIALDVARALEYAHGRKYVHRDVKPDNILITPEGVAKLADLGLAKSTGDGTQLTAHRQGFGTPYYMPCEQAIDAAHADARSDLYSLGATLYHLITGEVPFPGDTHLQIAERKLIGTFVSASVLERSVTASLDGILNRLLARDANDRYQTATELIAALKATKLSVPTLTVLDADLTAFQDEVIPERFSHWPATLPDLDAANYKKD